MAVVHQVGFWACMAVFFHRPKNQKIFTKKILEMAKYPELISVPGQRIGLSIHNTYLRIIFVSAVTVGLLGFSFAAYTREELQNRFVSKDLQKWSRVASRTCAQLSYLSHQYFHGHHKYHIHVPQQLSEPQ